MEEALRALLTGHAPLADLVGARIVWNHIPQGSDNPNVVLWKIAETPGYHMRGPDGLVATIVQIDVRSETVESMWAVSRIIKQRLRNFRGAQGATNFDGIFFTAERQSSAKPGDKLFHMAQLDFDVWSHPAT